MARTTADRRRQAERYADDCVIENAEVAPLQLWVDGLQKLVGDALLFCDCAERFAFQHSVTVAAVNFPGCNEIIACRSFKASAK